MSGATAGTGAAMRLATFNILNGRSLGDDHVDTARLADAVRCLDADVLALQEVDRNQPRSDHADLTAIAAEAMGADEHRFVAALTGSPATWIAADGTEQPDAAAYGIALLSRYPVTAWEVVRLPPCPVRVPMRFHGSRRPTLVRDEPRVAVVADIEVPAGTLTVAATHLTFLRPWNRVQLRRLLHAVTARSPLVVTGDLNMGQAIAVRTTGLQPLASLPTFPADHPVEQIDHVLGRAVGPGRASAPRLAVSDHRALVVDLPDLDAE
jgi:endonuclease/exonuclease/phosphatase family metal-dependent hydrolase